MLACVEPSAREFLKFRVPKVRRLYCRPGRLDAAQRRDGLKSTEGRFYRTFVNRVGPTRARARRGRLLQTQRLIDPVFHHRNAPPSTA